MFSISLKQKIYSLYKNTKANLEITIDKPQYNSKETAAAVSTYAIFIKYKSVANGRNINIIICHEIIDII